MVIIFSFPNSLHKQVYEYITFILTNSHNLKNIYCVIQLFLEAVEATEPNPFPSWNQSPIRELDTSILLLQIIMERGRVSTR